MTFIVQMCKQVVAKITVGTKFSEPDNSDRKQNDNFNDNFLHVSIRKQVGEYSQQIILLRERKKEDFMEKYENTPYIKSPVINPQIMKNT